MSGFLGNRTLNIYSGPPEALAYSNDGCLSDVDKGEDFHMGCALDHARKLSQCETSSDESDSDSVPDNDNRCFFFSS
jgi:hypothetical protein